MSDDVIIRAENIGKRYVLNHQTGGGAGGGSYRKFSDTLIHAAQAPLRWLNRASSIQQPATREDFWAIKDINFEIKRGEVVGIIGRNGAGKSTLLKILARITEPTTGRITLKGRVASLLEVGTGFHPELTGRENIFLNGAILGMRRDEIKAKFDEIVAFAEIERFLDTPVKRYSSGMYVRLAFAVAAHLEPEILIVDEVLAVGDVQFQKKCLGKMQDVAKGGRTVLFVSHNLPTIRDLCSRALCLSRGRIQASGEPRDVIELHLSEANGARPTEVNGHYIRRVRVSSSTVFYGDTVTISMDLTSPPNEEFAVNVEFRDQGNDLVFLNSSRPHDNFPIPRGRSLTLSLIYPKLTVAPGNYNVVITATVPEVRKLEEISFPRAISVLPKALPSSWPYEARFGRVYIDHSWELSEQQATSESIG